MPDQKQPFAMQPDADSLPPEDVSRLLQKGERLYGRCLQKNDTQCVFAFVNHQLSQGRHVVIAAYLDWLAAQYPATPQHKHLTRTLITGITNRLTP